MSNQRPASACGQDPKKDEEGYMGDTESSRAPRRKRIRKAHSPALGDAGSGFDAGASGSQSAGAAAGAAEKPVGMPYGMPSEAQLGLMKALAGFAKDAGGGKGKKT